MLFRSEIKNKTLNTMKRYCESNGIKFKKEKPTKSSTIVNEFSHNLKKEKNSIDNNTNNINVDNDQNPKILTENINKNNNRESAIFNSSNNIITKLTNKKLKKSSAPK